MALYKSFQKMKYFVNSTVWKKTDLRFSVKSKLGKSATLVSASEGTNFIFKITKPIGLILDLNKINFNKKKRFGATPKSFFYEYNTLKASQEITIAILST